MINYVMGDARSKKEIVRLEVMDKTFGLPSGGGMHQGRLQKKGKTGRERGSYE